jgi:HAD superfamily hydrolase (TIGR01484 family)
MKVIFASDLDRTLIYSKRMIDCYETKQDYQLIETLNEKPISYISMKTKKILKQLNEEMIFIPVTTRTVEQYQRISLFQNEIIPQYAITSNGGTIMKNGVIVKEWSEFIQEEMRSGIQLSEVIEKIENLPNNDWVERINQAEDFFVYLIINNDKLLESQLTCLQEWSMNCGFQMSLQGRKLYFIPNVINKWKAVQYVMNELNISKTYSAGDSLLDYDLIVNSHYGLVPAHGEVLQHNPKLRKTKTFGMNASEEIVTTVQREVFSNEDFLRSSVKMS